MRRRVGEEGSEETRGAYTRCSSLPSKARIAILCHICTLETNAHREAMFADARCISWHITRISAVGPPRLPEWSASNALASNYHCSCSLLAIAPTLPLDQGNPVAFIIVHAGLVCLGRYPSIDYQLALAVARGPSNRVPIFLSH
jgi:hypothetical protein